MNFLQNIYVVLVVVGHCALVGGWSPAHYTPTHYNHPCPTLPFSAAAAVMEDVGCCVVDMQLLPSRLWAFMLSMLI